MPAVKTTSCLVLRIQIQMVGVEPDTRRQKRSMKKNEKLKTFRVVKSWMFSFGGLVAFPVA
jgi:hypothetical protein